MLEWKPDLKRYPHFDKYLPEEKILNIVADPALVARNAFYPFIVYEKITERFRVKGKPPKKPRPIRYAARRDAYIYSYYRHLLSNLYEQKLAALGIAEHPIAYRRIPVAAGQKSGKCNIHFAKEVCEEITSRKSCYAVALDISSYFESLDHSKLYALWCELLGVNTLPTDHQAVFKNITSYAWVNLEKCYERLGYMGEVEVNGRKKKGFTRNPKDIPMQLCSGKDFKAKICGGDKAYSKLVERNKASFGIPQGSPISDLLANMYLLHFDKKVSDIAKEYGCYYRRYSDDILLLCPADVAVYEKVVGQIKGLIKEAGEKLVIKDEKTNVTLFRKDGDKIIAATVCPKGKQKPFEYLGFAFDGNAVKLKDNTLSKYYRKITFGVRREAVNLVARYNGKTPEQILGLADIGALYQKYGRIEEFDDSSDYRKWNFWTYAKRSAEIMNPLENVILQQLRNHRKKIATLLEEEIRKQHSKKAAPHLPCKSTGNGSP